MKTYNQIIKKYLKLKYRNILIGFTSVENIKYKFNIYPKTITDNLNYAISIGIQLSKSVLETIIDKPTKIYKYHYKNTNTMLDIISNDICQLIYENNYNAFPIPSSQVTDWKSMKAHLDHREIAVLAGLGWIGRNNLLITKEFGAQLRLVTILTDIPVKTAKSQLKNLCGKCVECISVCPAGAINIDNNKFDKSKCFDQVKKFSKIHDVGTRICGICIKVCGEKR